MTRIGIQTLWSPIACGRPSSVVAYCLRSQCPRLLAVVKLLRCWPLVAYLATRPESEEACLARSVALEGDSGSLRGGGRLWELRMGDWETQDGRLWETQDGRLRETQDPRVYAMLDLLHKEAADTRWL
jgi:hypothetical protein